MRRKILSIITILCLIFPCVFFVACKEKETLSSKDPYTYSICLKNAKGLIDENTLKSEFDYKENKNVNWTETDGNYTISATKVLSTSGEFVVNLLEGYDYSGTEIKINNQEKDYKIVCGENENVASEASLLDRQLSFEYENISSDTEIVVDFSNCSVAKITIDVSNLKSNNVTYFEVEDDFVTLKEAKNSNSFNTIEEDELVVDYGTIFAFNYSDSLAIKDSQTGVSKKLDYAIYGIRYFNSAEKNKVQYLTAKRNGACEVYSIREDNANNGTLRVLSSGGIKFASSLENLEAGVYENTETDDEVFYGENLEFTIFKGTKAILELDADAADFDYYLLDDINQTWMNALEIKNTEGDNSKTYLEIDLDSSESTKYLARKPASAANPLGGSSNYYTVAASNIKTNTMITNADYILINNNNFNSFGLSSDFRDDVYYGFKKDKDIKISLPATIVDDQTGFVKTIKQIKAYVYGNSNENLDVVTKNLEEEPTQILTISAYSSENDYECFTLSFSYSNKDGFSNNDFSLDTSEITLYEGEKVYYSTDLSSWKELNGEILTGSTLESKPIYYYISSPRTDSYLTIELTREGEKEIIGTSGILRDCFGRTMQGLISVGGTQIDLSKVMYLEIKPGYYGNKAQAKIIREYDKSYHEIELSKSYSDVIMLSSNGYKDTANFKDITTLSDLNLRYEGYEIGGELYYYVNSSINKYIVLKNSSGDIVSSSEVVYSNAKEYSINGKFVFQLSLNPNYYQEDEQFTIEIVTATYIIRAEVSDKAKIYKDNLQTQSASEIKLSKTYYVLCDNNTTLQLVDKYGTVVLNQEAFIEESDPISSNIIYNKKLYRFTFTLDNEGNYSPGSTFTIKVIQN